jgi:hypothetical protein
MSRAARLSTRRGGLMLTSDDAWARLPRTSGRRDTLPSWARLLAVPLPATTAAMLTPDALHRAGGPLDAGLRARLAATDENRCAYARAGAATRRAEAARGTGGWRNVTPDGPDWRDQSLDDLRAGPDLQCVRVPWNRIPDPAGSVLPAAGIGSGSWFGWSPDEFEAKM